MKDTKPTEDQLKELYEAAAAFKQAQPWKWLYDADIICVENPKDKMMGYCSVMGRAGEHFALGVYLDMEGLYGFNQLMGHADVIPSHQALHYQNCLMCSYEDRDILAEEDRKQIKVLGLSFRGRNAWPMFRRYEPGYYPWFINKEECVFLTHALRQVIFVAENVLNGQLRMDAEPKSGQILNFEMYDSIRDDANVCLNKLIDFCLKNGVPKEIQVRSEAMIVILDDFCKKTGIKLKSAKRLQSVDQILEEMAYRFW